LLIHTALVNVLRPNTKKYSDVVA